MSNYGRELLRMIEMLTSDNDPYEINLREITEERDIPSSVIDLMVFGSKAGEAVKAICDDGLDSIEATCPPLSRLAAVLTMRKTFYDKVYDLMHEITARIISALDKQELAEIWDGRTSHREFIETLAFIPGLTFCTGFFIEAVLNSMVNAFENFDGLSPEAVMFALKHMDTVACSNVDNNYFIHMLVMRREAINIIEAGEAFADDWKEKAIEALFSIDFESEIHLTEENEPMAEELVTDIMDNADPQNVAISAAWLSAIYRYTEYDNRIIEFFNFEINDIETEDHQEIVDDETSDDMAA